MMKRSFRDAWTAKLRSGEYTQARGTLAVYKDETCRCCLGVAYDPYDKPFPRYLHTNAPWELPATDDSEAWGLPLREVSKLAGMNDAGNSFAQIADYIDTLPVEDA